MSSSEHDIPYRVGPWLPSDAAFLARWLALLAERSEAEPRALHPVVAELGRLIEEDAELYMLFHRMFEQIPRRPPYHRDPTGRPQVRDYREMLRLINTILTQAPEFDRSGLVGCPINSVLDWAMGTPAGATAFLNPRLNAQLKRVLDAWGRFLRSPDSAYVLNEDPHRGWLGADALAAMPGFRDDFVCDPSAPHWGFGSWDDFFTRRLRPGARPVAHADDPAVIVNACESAPYRIARRVQLEDRFWIKSQPYSIRHMLAGDPLAELFAGGTVYQAFLSPLCYHRWHSPVDGRVIKVRVQPGSYYAEALSEGYDPAGPNDSQAYLAEVATRALIFIEADHADIGLLCFLGIGMAEVSTCDITAYEGQRVRKGDEIGMFHFGGSTHCLLFRGGVRLEFDHHGQQPGLHARTLRINERIARVAHAG